jgi:hypothetical protein
VQYEFIASPYKHSVYFKFFIDQDQEIKPLVHDKIQNIAAAPEEKYVVPGCAPGDVDAIQEHFGQQLYNEILQMVVQTTIKHIIDQEQIHPCTVLTIEAMAAEDQRLKYFCVLAKLPPVTEIAAHLHVVKPMITITDACIDFYLHIQRVTHSPQDARLLSSGMVLGAFDMIRCLVFATNIPRYLNVHTLNCLLGADREYFAIEQQLIGQQLRDTSYTLITPLGYITLLICQAQRLNHVISLDALQSILQSPQAQIDIKEYTHTTLKNAAVKPSHVYMVTTIMQQIQKLEDIDICPSVLKRYTEQAASQSPEQAHAHYLQAVAHLLVYGHIPQEAGEPFINALADIEPQTLIALGYMDEDVQYEPDDLRMRQTFYQSLQYLSQDMHYEEKMMSLRDFYQALATLTTSTYR